MNILPHKSWHVRTKKNIERVRKDEEQAANEEKERQRKIALAEQEARTEVLRGKAKKRLREAEEGHQTGSVDNGGGSIEAVQINEQNSLRHINFFSEAEEGKKTSGTNKEHEAEKKAEQEKLEMSIGLLTYLGQGSAESQTVKPWYMRKSEKSEAEIGKTIKERKKKEFLDPMNEMMEFVNKKNKSSREKHKHEKEKRHKHKHARREQGKTGPSKIASSPSKTMEQLRAERTRREAEEKLRTQQLLAKLRGETIPEDKDTQAETESQSRRYNSQYNPELVRRPKKRDTEPSDPSFRHSESGQSSFKQSSFGHSSFRNSDRYGSRHSEYSRHGKHGRGKYY